MGESDGLLEFLWATDRRERLDRHLELHHLVKVDDPGFALTPRTRRLRRWDNEEAEDPGQPNPFVLIQLVPTEPLERRWSLRDPELSKWLSPNERRYAPYTGGFFLYPSTRTACGGLMFENERRESPNVHDYLFLGQDGLIEIGLCNSVVRRESNGRSAGREASEPARPYFLLLAVVGSVWRLLQFAHEWHEKIKLQSPVSLVLAARDTGGSQLGGFAQGWREPWDSFRGGHSVCTDPAVRLIYPSIPTGNAEAVEPLVRELAIEFEACWGMLTDSREARCFIAPNRENAGQFDENNFAGMMR